MKKLSDVFKKENNEFLNECVIVAKKFEDSFILAKNRDRPYNPKVKLIHDIVNGIEMVYMLDVDSDWSEGMNEFGISIVNSALFVIRDEGEKNVENRLNVDGKIIRKALESKTVEEAVKAIEKGDLKGHTFVSDGNRIFTIENTENDNVFVDEITSEDNIVRTNHGMKDSNGGYKNGLSYKSSSIRKYNATKLIRSATDKDDVLIKIRKRLYEKDSVLNTKRESGILWTSSQILLDPKNLEVKVTAFSDKIECADVESNIPEGYENKIKLYLDVI